MTSYLSTKEDQAKLRKFVREHDHANMARRKANEHAKLRLELDARQRSIAKKWITPQWWVLRIVDMLLLLQEFVNIKCMDA